MLQIPYVVSDFKPGNIVHVIGEYDDQYFDDIGTVITTSDFVDNPYSGDDSILVRFDGKRDTGLLHDGGTGDIDIRRACNNRCWWLAEWEWNPNSKNEEEYYREVDYDYNRLKKLNDDLPNVYDLISSLTESDAKNKFGLHNLKQGDKAIISFKTNSEYMSLVREAKDVIGTSLGDDDPYDNWRLFKFEGWHGGHDGHGHPKCGRDDCYFLTYDDVPEMLYFDYIIIKPMVNAYELISSLFEAEEDDYDWAFDMAKNVLKSSELTQIPRESATMWYLILFDLPGLDKDVFEKTFKYIMDNTNWRFKEDEEMVMDRVYRYYLSSGSAYICLKPESYRGHFKQGYGSGIRLFESHNNKKITDEDVVVIRPY